MTFMTRTPPWKSPPTAPTHDQAALAAILAALPEAVLAIDADDRIVINRAAKPVRLLHPHGHSHFAMLREKLHWGAHL